jgi:glycosyltransferase involved in cell wall biosynthesis
MNKQIKILHIIDTLGLGGAQTVVKGIFEHQKDNQNIFLFALRKKDITFSVMHPHVFIYDSFKKYSFSPLFKLKTLIKKEEIDVLHCHLFRSQIFGLLLKIIWFKNIKLIFHEHGQIFEKDNVYMIYILFIRFAKRYVSLFVVVSGAIKKHLISKTHTSEDKIKILYNFVDLEKFNRKKISWDIDKEKRKLNIKPDEFVIGFAGRLVERKGWKEFISSAHELSSLNIKFLIAGDGEDREKMLKLIGSNKNIMYLGYVSEMLKFYSYLDIFVIPSWWEPMGLTEIEAQSMGVPVIASDVEGLNEIIINNKNGLLFKSKNTKELIGKIKLLYKDNELRNMLVKNGLSDIKKYSLVDYLIKLKETYKKLK